MSVIDVNVTVISHFEILHKTQMFGSHFKHTKKTHYFIRFLGQKEIIEFVLINFILSIRHRQGHKYNSFYTLSISIKL